MVQKSAGSGHVVLLVAAGLAVTGLASEVRADDAPVNASTSTDKSQYNLFNVTPASQLRPLSADTDDGVTDPTTVDAGYVEVQGSLVNYYRYDTGPFNASGSSSGYDGINIGAKINLWGNDGGKTALAVAPYISIPNGGDTVEGGADIPFAVRLPYEFYLKFVFDPYAFENHHTIYFGMDNSMSLHKGFGTKLDVYAYLNTTYRSDSEPWYGYTGFGAGYLFSPNVEVFLGIGFGLTDNAYDYNPRLGLAWRF